MAKELLSDAIDNYLRFRRSQDYSKATLRLDGQVLRKFLSVVGNIWVHQIGERQVNAHMESATKTRSNSSMRNDHNVLNGFFKWARNTGRMAPDIDPMYGRRQPRLVQRERARVPVRDFPRLLEAAGERSPRDRALVALLLYTLMRDSEATRLRVRDLDLDDGWVTAYVPKSRLEDRMPVCEELDAEMRLWLTEYTKAVGHLDPGYYLVPTRGVAPLHNKAGRIYGHSVYYKPTNQILTAGKIVRPALEDIGFVTTNAEGKGAGEGAHTIRRSGARALFDSLVAEGYDHALRVVQSLLHHKNMSQTEHYIGVTADRRSRDEILRGKRMYAAPDQNVVRLAR